MAQPVRTVHSTVTRSQARMYFESEQKHLNQEQIGKALNLIFQDQDAVPVFALINVAVNGMAEINKPKTDDPGIPKIVDGTITLGGVLYKAFEMFDDGPWMIVCGVKYNNPRVASHIRAKSGKQAINEWLKMRNSD